MMISVKNKSALEKMRVAGKHLAEITELLCDQVKDGISTVELDNFIAQQLASRGMISCTKGYRTYRHSSCISVNDEVVHGVPKADRKIVKGDLVKIDICASWNGYCADMARCFFVGENQDSRLEQLVTTAQRALDEGIAQVRKGGRLTDISHAIQTVVDAQGFGILRDFAGHGIGKRMHEEPEILNYGEPGKGPIMQVGMAFAIEPMITVGSHEVYIATDGWTVKTKDKSWAAHVEDTVVVTENGPEILTRL